MSQKTQVLKFQLHCQPHNLEQAILCLLHKALDNLIPTDDIFCLFFKKQWNFVNFLWIQQCKIAWLWPFFFLVETLEPGIIVPEIYYYAGLVISWIKAFSMQHKIGSCFNMQIINRGGPFLQNQYYPRISVSIKCKQQKQYEGTRLPFQAFSIGADFYNCSNLPIFPCYCQVCNGLKILEVKCLEILFFTLSHPTCLWNSQTTWRNSYRKIMNAAHKHHLLDANHSDS